MAAGWLTGRSRRLSAAVALAGAGIPLVARLLDRVGRWAGDDPDAMSRRPEHCSTAADPPEPITVIVPARNEAAIIGPLLHDLAAQDLRGPDGRLGFEIVVIDDRSTDGTGERAGEAIVAAGIQGGAGVLRRDSGPEGKGAALAWLGTDRTGVTVVFDADARIGSHVVRRLVVAGATTRRSVTARRRMLLPRHGSWRRRLAQLQDDELTLDGAVQLARAALGGGSELRGNGMAVRNDTLRAVGGWPAGAVTEDLELSTLIYLQTGAGIGWLPELEVYEQPVLRIDHLAGQRLRWAEGAIRRDIRHVVPVLMEGRGTVRARTDLAIYAGHLLLGWYLVGLAIGGRGGRKAAAAVIAGYGVGTTILAQAALRRFDTASPGGHRRLARAIGVALFAGAWLPVTAAAWVRVAIRGDAVHFERTVKTDEFESTTAPLATSRRGGA